MLSPTISILHMLPRLNCCQPAPIHCVTSDKPGKHSTWSGEPHVQAIFLILGPLALRSPSNGSHNTVEWQTSLAAMAGTPSQVKALPHRAAHTHLGLQVPLQHPKAAWGAHEIQQDHQEGQTPASHCEEDWCSPWAWGTCPTSPLQCSALPNKGWLRCNQENRIASEKGITDLEHVRGSGLLWII